MNVHAQIVAALEARASQRTDDGSCADGTHRLNIKTLAVRQIARQCASQFQELSWHDQVQGVCRLLNDGRDKVAHSGIFLMGLTIHAQEAVDISDLDSLIALFQGWSVTDAFCIEVLQPLLVRFPTEMESLLASWSTAGNRWKRRASVVIFTRKIGASGQYTDQGLQACEKLINDRDDLVRKGVGWALKDLMRGDRERVFEYILHLRERGVSSVITLYALKDISGEDRKRALGAGVH